MNNLLDINKLLERKAKDHVQKTCLHLFDEDKPLLIEEGLELTYINEGSIVKIPLYEVSWENPEPDTFAYELYLMSLNKNSAK